MRRCGLRSAKLQITNSKWQIRQRGYMLITLMLALALIAIALLTVLPDIGQQIRRDREEELRHRGTEYMRAIQHFYRKFGRYPARLEELENTNNLRFIRKRYTDPMSVDPVTGKEKDFKLLHQTDISLNNGPVLDPTGQNSFFANGQSGPGAAQGGLGGLQGGLGGLGAQPGGLQNPPSGNAGNSSFGNSSFGNSSSSNSPSGDAAGASNSPGSSSSNSNSGSGLNGPTFGGGPILGVASTSKAKTVRIFFTKNHYNDWLFIYLPMADRGGLLTGPVNPSLQTAMGGLTPSLPGGVAGQAGFGQGGLGQVLGQGLSPNGGQNQGLQAQTPPPPVQTPQQ
jgi:type II secretory pathway pseudopilin PulG